MTTIIGLSLTLLFTLVIRPTPACTVSLLFANKPLMDPNQPESASQGGLEQSVMKTKIKLRKRLEICLCQ